MAKKITDDKDKDYKPSAEERARVTFLQDRFQEIELAEKNKGLRDNLAKWNKLYKPHKFAKTGMKDWQSNSSKNLSFTKVQTALAVLIENNPQFQYFARTNQDKPMLLVWKYLMEYIDDVGKATAKLKQFAFNQLKDGTGVGQVYWKHDTRKVKYQTEYDPETDVAKYEDAVVEDFNNPYWTVLERKDVYIDEKARTWNPYGEHPVRDWFKIVIYDKDGFDKRFPKEKYPNAEFVKSGGELAMNTEGTDKTLLQIGKDEYVVAFYESKPEDQFSIMSADGVLLKDIPLPYRHKQLSIFGAKMFDKPEDIDGIGIPEAIENDEAMLDLLSNTRLDQIILNIYRTMIIGYGEEPEDYELELRPNGILRLRDPNAAKWMEQDKVGGEAFNEEAVIKDDVADKTGVSKELLGSGERGKQTATETAINREAGLRRLKTALDNIESAMEIKQRLMMALTKQIYAIPTKTEIDQGIETLTYKEVRLPVNIKGVGEEMKIEEAQEENIVEMKPSLLMNEPDIKIKHMSMMPISHALVQQEKTQFYSLIAEHPYLDAYKSVSNLCGAYNEDPNDWLKTEQQIAQEQQQALQAAQQGVPIEGGEGEGAMGPTRKAVPTEGGTASVPIEGGQQSTFKKFFQKLTGRNT